MQAASVIIIAEPQWKPATEEQAIARAHRMSQVRKVQVHRLLAKGSVDERLLEVQQKKSLRSTNTRARATPRNPIAAPSTPTNTDPRLWNRRDPAGCRTASELLTHAVSAPAPVGAQAMAPPVARGWMRARTRHPRQHVPARARSSGWARSGTVIDCAWAVAVMLAASAATCTSTADNSSGVGRSSSTVTAANAALSLVEDDSSRSEIHGERHRGVVLSAQPERVLARLPAPQPSRGRPLFPQPQRRRGCPRLLFRRAHLPI